MKKQLLILAILYGSALSLKAQSLYGVDVYSGNGTITWSQVLNATKTFAYIKATKGECYTDGAFNTNIVAANSAGVVTGCYHFALPEQYSAVGEANYFYAAAGSYISGCHLPPALDLEDPAGECVTNTTALSTYYSGNMSALAQWVNAWATQVYSLSGVWPVLYTTRCYAGSLYPYYQSGTISANVKLWIADYSDAAGSPGNYSGCSPWVGWPWLFQQFSAPGTAGNNPNTGANPGMDQDIFNGNLAAFDALTGCGNTATCTGFTTSPASANVSASGGTGSFTLSFTGGCTLNYLTNPCPWVTFSGTNGTITYTVTANCGAAQQCTLDFTYNGNTVTTFTVYQAAATSPQPPSITPSPSTTICPGAQEQLTASETNCSNCTYNWNTGASGATLTVYPTTSTGYTVTVTNTCALSATNGYYVNVASTPNQPVISPTSGCSPLAISASTSACSGCNYSWSTPSGNNSGSPIQGSTSGTYYVTVTNDNGCTASNSSYVSVTNAPMPNATITSSNSNPICTNSSTTLSVPTCTGCTYNWSSGSTSSSTNVSAAGTYYATVTNNCQASVTGSYAVTTASAPTNVSISGTSTICQNGTAYLTAVPNYSNSTYNWSYYGSSGSSNAISVSPNSSEQITVTVTNSCGNAVSNPFSLTVNAVPPQPGAISGSSNPCAGSQQTYSVNFTSGETYNWSLPQGWTNSSNTNSITSTVGSANGTISVTANNTCGASTPQTLTVNPVTVTVLPVTASPNQVCQGATVALTANAGGTSYQWAGNHVVQTSSNITTAMPTASGSINYTVTETINTCTASATVNITVLPSVTPSFTLSQSPIPVCLDGTHTVTVTPNPVNGGTPTYTWSSNCGNSSTGGQYTLNNLSTPCTVSCTLTSNAECASPTTVTNSISVQSSAPVQAAVTISTPATQVCLGSNVTFTASPTNGGSPNYQWYVGGIASGTGPLFNIYNIQNNATVNCSMTSSLSCTSGSPATSNTENIVVVSQAIAGVTITDSPSTTVCSGTPVTFTASAGNGGTAPIYQWRVNGTNTGGAGTANTFTTSTLPNGAIVTCVMTSNSTCVSIDTANSNPITISVNQTVVPTISITDNPIGVTCAGTTVTFTAVATNGGTSPTYQWKAGGNNVGNNSNNYTSSSLTNNEVVVCQLTSSANCAVPSIVTSGNVVVQVDQPVTPSTNITANPTGPICIGSNVTFTASVLNGGNSPTFTWMNNGHVVGANANTYSTSGLVSGERISCLLTSNANCALPDTAYAFIIPTIDSFIIPAVTITASPATATCAGTPVTFTATAAGGGTPIYQWIVNGLPVTNNSANFTTSSVANGDTVSCIINSSLACANPSIATSNKVSLTVKAAPDTALTPEGIIPICAGDTIPITASANNLLYKWNTGASTQKIWVSDGGDYWVTVTNADNCTAQSSVAIIVVNSLPLTPVVTQNADTLSTNPGMAVYQWYLNNAPVSGATGPVLVALQNGQYRVEVTDTNRCSSTSATTNITSVGITILTDVVALNISPNPSEGLFMVNFETRAACNIQISIFDPIGRLIESEPEIKVSGIYSTQVDLRRLASGLYILQLKSGNKVLNRKIEIK